MYERDEFLRDRIRPHQPGTPRGYSPRPPSGDRCPAPPPGRHAAAATPPGPPRLPSAPLRPLPDPAWPRQPEAPPPSTWADPALAPIRSRTRPGERGWRRMVRLVTFGLVGLGGRACSARRPNSKQRYEPSCMALLCLPSGAAAPVRRAPSLVRAPPSTRA